MRDAVRATLWEVAARIDASDVPGAATYLASLHPADQADVLAELDGEERTALLATLDPESLAAILEHLTPQEMDTIAPELDTGQLAAALTETGADIAADVLHALEDDAAPVLDAMTDTSDVEPLLAHEDESAGGIMSPHLIAFRPATTAAAAIEQLRALQPRAAEAYYLYVVDAVNRLLGVVSLRDLVTAQPETRLDALMARDVISTTADTDQEDVLRLIQHYNLRAVPVVDAEQRLVGVASADDLIGVAEQEATEDMYRMVGLSDAETLRAPECREYAPLFVAADLWEASQALAARLGLAQAVQAA